MAIITERIGDIFSAPPNSVLIHACNARGSWAAGVALAFKRKYPAAYEIYHAHCTTPPPTIPSNPPSSTTTNPNSNTTNTKAKAKLAAYQSSLVGTTLLIPPSEGGEEKGKGEGHWIACLFTSAGYGRNVSKAEVILDNTRRAVEDLGRQVGGLRKSGSREEGGGDGEGKGDGERGEEDGERGREVPGECWAVRINSGLFGVPWGETKRVLEGGGVGMCVVRPGGKGEGEEGEEGEKGEVGDGGGKEEGKGAEEKGGKKRAALAVAGLENRRKKRGLEGWLEG